MSLFKMSVSIPMFNMRMDAIFTQASAEVRKSLTQRNKSGILGDRLYEAIRHHTDALVGFAMAFTLKMYLKPWEAQAVLERFHLTLGVVTGGEHEYYWSRFNSIPERKGVLATMSGPALEYMMAGSAFLEQCGKTDNQEMNDSVRAFGADTFAKVCDLTRKEIKSVRLYP